MSVLKHRTVVDGGDLRKTTELWINEIWHNIKRYMLVIQTINQTQDVMLMNKLEALLFLITDLFINSHTSWSLVQKDDELFPATLNAATICRLLRTNFIEGFQFLTYPVLNPFIFFPAKNIDFRESLLRAPLVTARLNTFLRLENFSERFPYSGCAVMMMMMVMVMMMMIISLFRLCSISKLETPNWILKHRLQICVK